MFLGVFRGTMSVLVRNVRKSSRRVLGQKKICGAARSRNAKRTLFLVMVGGRGGTIDQNMTPGRWSKNIISENRPVRVTPNPEMGMCPGKIGLETFKNAPHFA